MSAKADRRIELAREAAEILPADERERMIERGARAVYAKRPFRTGSTISPLEPGVMDATTFGFDEAPAYYQEQCREIAEVVLDAVVMPWCRP